MRIADKIVIVTGASSGIGLATATLLAQKKATVVLVARSKAKMKEIAKNIPNSFVYEADMREEKEIENMISSVVLRYGRIDVLINNAGRGYDAPVEKINRKKFEELFRLNLFGPLVAMQEVIPLMRKQGGGIIINISSGTSLRSIPYIGAYASLKRALNGITLTARQELKKDTIKVCVVYPYITATDFYKNRMSEIGGKEPPRTRDQNLPPQDSPAYVAKKIMETIESEKAEIFAHDWMNPQTEK